MSRKGEIAKMILQIAAVGGVLVVGALAPNAAGAILKMMGPPRAAANRRHYFHRAARRLADRGLIKLANNKQGQTVLRLTPRGRQELAKYEVGELKIEIPKRWDGHYRLIVFDIKEWKRGVRNGLRAWLGNLGFVRLQNSVWVYPYECQEVVTLLKSYFRVGGEVLYVVAKSIENDKWLRRHFQLV